MRDEIPNTKHCLMKLQTANRNAIFAAPFCRPQTDTPWLNIIHNYIYFFNRLSERNKKGPKFAIIFPSSTTALRTFTWCQAPALYIYLPHLKANLLIRTPTIKIPTNSAPPFFAHYLRRDFPQKYNAFYRTDVFSTIRLKQNLFCPLPIEQRLR